MIERRVGEIGERKLLAVRGGRRRVGADRAVEPDQQHAFGADAPAMHIVDQRNEAFVPYVQLLRPGDTVVFRNSDSTRHHVYSFAPARAFEFVIPSGESSPPVTLATPGEIAVGCNIHDLMITHLYVSDAPWFGRTGADGRAAFKALPPGTYTVQVWHPQLRPGRPGPQREVAVGEADAEAAFVLPLLPDPRRDAGNRERSAY
jgi:plastocyanin